MFPACQSEAPRPHDQRSGGAGRQIPKLIEQKFGKLRFGISDLFKISNFVLRIWYWKKLVFSLASIIWDY
jgi:hypothetical protein